jgi:hypothetical protein
LKPKKKHDKLTTILTTLFCGYVMPITLKKSTEALSLNPFKLFDKSQESKDLMIVDTNVSDQTNNKDSTTSKKDIFESKNIYPSLRIPKHTVWTDKKATNPFIVFIIKFMMQMAYEITDNDIEIINFSKELNVLNSEEIKELNVLAKKSKLVKNFVADTLNKKLTFRIRDLNYAKRLSKLEKDHNEKLKELNAKHQNLNTLSNTVFSKID